MIPLTRSITNTKQCPDSAHLLLTSASRSFFFASDACSWSASFCSFAFCFSCSFFFFSFLAFFLFFLSFLPFFFLFLSELELLESLSLEESEASSWVPGFSFFLCPSSFSWSSLSVPLAPCVPELLIATL